ncbi:unnamed protein product [Onchocerca flexuosa]|uniref:Uncharacterized protein n=1 Tax=Onchocerca flexuosa TaxID=387005 RepID=A0A183I237_9BILA|nr:unnamed protein product [Onchocerca flexuosa]
MATVGIFISQELERHCTRQKEYQQKRCVNDFVIINSDPHILGSSEIRQIRLGLSSPCASNNQLAKESTQ